MGRLWGDVHHRSAHPLWGFRPTAAADRSDVPHFFARPSTTTTPAITPFYGLGNDTCVLILYEICYKKKNWIDFTLFSQKKNPFFSTCAFIFFDFDFIFEFSIKFSI